MLVEICEKFLPLINWLAHFAFGVEVNLAAHVFKLLGHLVHAFEGFDGIEGLFLIIGKPVRVIAHILRDFHRAEFRPAHGAEMGDLMRVFGQGLIMDCLLYTSPSPRD